MDKSITVEPKPWDVLVVNEVLALEVESVVFIPISTDRQDSGRAFLKRHHVRQRDAGLFALLVLVLEPRQVQEHVHLKNTVAIVLDRCHAHLFCFLLLDVVQLIRRLAQVQVAVEPSLHQPHNLLLGLTHHMSNALGVLNVGGTVRNYDVLGGDKHRDLASLARVIIDLLERRARNRQ